MATIRPVDLPAAASVAAGNSIIIDNGATVEKATPTQVVNAAIPLATQAEAEAGTDNAKRVTPLRVAQAISAKAATVEAVTTNSFADVAAQDIPVVQVRIMTSDRGVLVEEASITDSYTDEKTAGTVTNAGQGYWWTTSDSGTRFWRVDGPVATTTDIGLEVADAGTPVDVSEALQSAMESGFYQKLIFTAMHYITWIYQPGDVQIEGLGPGTGWRMLPEIRYCNVGGATEGEYGWSSKTGATAMFVRNVEIDGNAATCRDLTGGDGQAGNYESTLDGGGSFEVGRIKQYNLRSDNIGDDAQVVWENIYSHDAVRNCFLHQAGTLYFAGLISENSDLDHGFYSDRGSATFGSGITHRGYARDGVFVLSNHDIAGLKWESITANPHTNPETLAAFQTKAMISDRSDGGRASTVRGITIVGDLSLVDTASIGMVVQCLSALGSYSDIRVIRDGGAVDTALYGVSSMGTSGAPGTNRGISVCGMRGDNLPSKFQPFVSDPDAFGHNLIGATLNDFDLVYDGAGVSEDLALFEFNGVNVIGLRASDVIAVADDNGASGPARLFDENLSSALRDVQFDGCSRDNSSNSYEPVTLSGTASIEDVSVTKDYSDNLTPTSTATGSPRTAIAWGDSIANRCRFSNGYSVVRTTASFTGDASTTQFEKDLSNPTLRLAPSWARAHVVGTTALPAIGALQLKNRSGSGSPARGAVNVIFSSAPASGGFTVQIEAGI